MQRPDPAAALRELIAGRPRGRHVSAVEETLTLWIKICGLSTVAAIEAAVAAGVQAVGFVFHEPSPRNLAIAAAMTLQAAVPAGVERVAVFLHPGQELVDAVIDDVRPDCLQLDIADIAASAPAAGSARAARRAQRRGDWPANTGECSRFMLEGAHSGAGETSRLVRRRATGPARRAGAGRWSRRSQCRGRDRPRATVRRRREFWCGKRVAA